jgi:hypothetical protein
MGISGAPIFGAWINTEAIHMPGYIPLTLPNGDEIYVSRDRISRTEPVGAFVRVYFVDGPSLLVKHLPDVVRLR